jgi:hypothetical protein
MRVAGFTPEAAELIHRRVLGGDSRQSDADVSKQRTVHNSHYFVKLLADLPSAENALTGQSEAQALILRYIQPVDPSSLDMEECPDQDDTKITVTNRSVAFSAYTNQVLLVVRVGSEWTPLNSIGNHLQCILEETLYAAVDTFTDPSTARACVLRRNDSGNLVFTGQMITVTNRLEYVSVDADTYIRVEWLDGEWHPYVADCGTQSESIQSCSFVTPASSVTPSVGEGSIP